MRREWEPEELIAAWTLLDDDWELVGNKTRATCLGFSLLLKCFEQEGRCSRHAGEVPKAAVDYVAGQVKVEPELSGEYRWSGSTIEYLAAGREELVCVPGAQVLHDAWLPRTADHGVGESP